jgi:hypothetical protein
LQSNVTKKVLRSRKGNVSKRKKETSEAQLSGAEILLRSLGENKGTVNLG